jgi:hypothetical protein
MTQRCYLAILSVTKRIQASNDSDTLANIIVVAQHTGREKELINRYTRYALAFEAISCVVT